MNDVPRVECGQRVFVQNRKHPFKDGYYDCYGTITAVFREEDDDEDSYVEMIIVTFEDSNTTAEFNGSSIICWADKYQSWTIQLEQL